ncbi:hypothetical protein JavanS175_0014 [Streptococcus satellite phage Javan175]|uniref:hypothetical protein n=1 Tax=Streptococcus entericus TaxID=155680 RepID=UPI000376CDBC|nr:hypothetical protein [Streptococcus entericus]QBX07755.1 hypothetical protein JavanS175_0014 [Streptococcus satellite phage Javan175]
MSRTPFTQDLLREVYDHNGLVSFDLIASRLKGWTDDDIKKRLYQWRMRGVITYRLEEGEIVDFEFLKNNRQEVVELSAGRRLKLEKFFEQVEATTAIIKKATTSDTNRLKAIQLQQVALNEIPDDIYKELVELND